MPAQSTTIRPKTLKEIRQALTNWWGQSHKRLPAHVRFSQPSHSEDRLRMWSQLGSNVRLQFDKNELSCERAGRKFHLLLDDFDVKAEVDGRVLLFEFKVSANLNRPLKDRLTSAQKTKHPIFFSRGINALEELEKALPRDLIDEASAASTDFMVLVEALTARSLAAEIAANDPLATARLRGVERQQSLVEKSGGMLKGEKAAKVLGISRQAVDKRRRQNRLIGLTQGRRGYAYPIWQFEGGKTLANLETVLDRLRDHDPWMQLTFFLNANDRLEGSSPLEMLRCGKLKRVLEAAASYGEQGAA
ncbi:MAG: hypothetical protein WBR17_18790 [Paraburkholderia sp.]|uniref:hypothetical protein n=1 Tax=Paraburkholderia sp. TaxID=1926495 RepID=UPI003C5FBC3E